MVGFISLRFLGLYLILVVLDFPIIFLRYFIENFPEYSSLLNDILIFSLRIEPLKIIGQSRSSELDLFQLSQPSLKLLIIKDTWLRLRFQIGAVNFPCIFLSKTLPVLLQEYLP